VDLQREREVNGVELERAKAAPLKIGFTTSRVGESHWLPDLPALCMQNTIAPEVGCALAVELKTSLPTSPNSPWPASDQRRWSQMTPATDPPTHSVHSPLF